MKTLLLYTFAAFSTLVTAIPFQEQRPNILSPRSGIKIEQLQSEFSPTYRRTRVTYGRYHLLPYNETKLSMGAGMDMGGNGMDMGGKGMNMGGKGMAMASQQGQNTRRSTSINTNSPPHPGGMQNEGGLVDVSDPNAPKPCSDCTLKYAQSTLTYADGRTANFHTGAAVHHLTMSIAGPGRNDLRCPDGTARVPAGTERMLAFHNDRNATFFGLGALDPRGFYLGAADTVVLELMLKNEVAVPQEVEYSIEWEWVPGRPDGWADVRGIWVDVAACAAMMSDVEMPRGQTRFTLEGREAWTSSVSGRLLNTVGHMHDGGVALRIALNGREVCASRAEYAGSPDYVPTKEIIALGAADKEHISRYTPCNDIGPIKKGDVITVSADYDLDKHKPVVNKIGADSDVMGLAMVFVEVDK